VKDKKKMDSRCPRKLEELPCEYCPLAVLRLKALRNSDKELTEEEEALLPGCPWALNHQMSNYCFFSYAAEYLNAPPSDKEIAHMNNISVETVKEIEREAIEKIKEFEIVKDLREADE
jgi:DNA-directed RNA polymerase sigma subunit (sigma70/sigma32)